MVPARCLQVIERSVSGDAPRPRSEAARGIEARVGAMDTPEGFHREVFGSGWIADNVNNPAVNLTLMRAEQRLESVEVAMTELPQHVRWLFQKLASRPLLYTLTARGSRGLQVFPTTATVNCFQFQVNRGSTPGRGFSSY